MATARTRVLRFPEPEEPPLPPPIDIDVPAEELAPGVTLKNGVLSTELPGGFVDIDMNPDLSKAEGPTDKFYDNLANKIDSSNLGQIATDLLDGIQRDDDSRKEWLETRARGISLLGLRLEDPRGDLGASSAAVEGQSTVRHPLLLEATVRFQATARGELLPASGPVKIRNDTPTPPPAAAAPPQPAPQPGAPPPPPVVGPFQDTDNLAEALEKDMNHYLTAVATEYVPDTDRMLFYIGFGGDGFKKVYNCPLRRRPVSESVDAEDLIVSNAATDIRNCGRVTHKIKMRKSVMRRMQILGAYRDVELNQPNPATPNAVEQKKLEIAGQSQGIKRPEDQDYTVYETYCELDLDEYAPKHFKGRGVPLPYRVTLEKDSRQVLSVIRNWKKDDHECLAKPFFVQFPFIRGIGFYGLGFIHLLGNTTSALTAAWRETLDAGMFANFPGFLYAKQVGRQLSNQFRVPPGGGIGLDMGPQGDIRSAVMPLPYKEVGASFTGFITHMEEMGAKLGMTAEANVGEGKQDAPVGTTLALIEQSTKTLDAVHKRLHAAQSEEFALLKERFKEDPEAFWRHNKRPTLPWKKEQFLKALDDHDMVPVADPNNPTSLHRAAKAATIKQLQAASPALYNAMAVDMRIMRITNIDPEGLFNATPTPPPPDPRMEAIKAKAAGQQQQNEIQLMEAKIKAATAAAGVADKAQDRASREKIEEMKLELARLKLLQEQVIHAHDAHQDTALTQAELAQKHQQNTQDLHTKHAQNLYDMGQTLTQHDMDLQHRHEQHQQDVATTAEKHRQEVESAQERHRMDIAAAEEAHKVKMESAKELHQQRLKEIAARRKAKPSKG